MSPVSTKNFEEPTFCDKTTSDWHTIMIKRLVRYSLKLLLFAMVIMSIVSVWFIFFIIRPLYYSEETWWLLKRIEAYVTQYHNLPTSLADLGLPESNYTYYDRTHILVSTNIEEYLTGNSDLIRSKKLNDAQNRSVNKQVRVYIEGIMNDE